MGFSAPPIKVIQTRQLECNHNAIGWKQGEVLLQQCARTALFCKVLLGAVCSLEVSSFGDIEIKWLESVWNIGQ